MKIRRCNRCGVRGVMRGIPSRYSLHPVKHPYYISCPNCRRTGAPGKTKEEAIVNWWKAVEKRQNKVYEFVELEGMAV